MMDPAAGIVCLLGGDSQTLSVRQWGKEGKVQVGVWFGARFPWPIDKSGRDVALKFYR